MGRKSKKSPKPGWNAYVADFFARAREASTEWILIGRPRNEAIFEQKRVTNAQYKYAVQYISKNERAKRADSMARNLLCYNTYAFWKEVKSMSSCKKPLPLVVDGTSGNMNILELWRLHYSK